MATFRKIHTTFWTDPFVEECTQEQKLFYLYLITNTKTKQCGIYEISKRYISYETGFSLKEVTELLDFFKSNGKIDYSTENNEVMICNWNKFNYNTSYQTITCIHNELAEVKSIDFIKTLYDVNYMQQLLTDIESKKEHKSKYTPFMEYLYSMHTPSMDNGYSMHTPSMDNKQEEKEQEQEKAEEEVEVQQQVELQEQEKAEEEEGQYNPNWDIDIVKTQLRTV